jgi:carbamoyl-phosphate synthase large subunit
VQALKEEGYRVVLVNSNPATIMTGPRLCRPHLHRADDGRRRHCDHRGRAPRRAAADDGRADRPSTSRSTLHEAGVLEKYGVELIGANIGAIKKAEDRDLFKQAMANIGLDLPRSGYARSYIEASASARTSGCRSSSGRRARSAAPARASRTRGPSSSRD